MKSKDNEGFRHPFGSIDLIKVVAYLRVQGMLEAEIGILLFGPNLKNPAAPVSRMLRVAKKDRIYRETFNEASMDPRELEELRTSASRAPYIELFEKLAVESGGTLKDLRVFHSAPGLATKSSWGLHLASFANNSSWYLEELLGNSKSGIAVGWGRTIFELIQALRARGMGPVAAHSRRRPVVVIPTVGEPLGPEAGMSSSRLARNLSESLNGTSRDVPSLEGITSVLPDSFSSAEKRKLIMEYIELIKGYRDVFGTTNEHIRGLIHKVDTIFTSVGSFESWQKWGSNLMIDAGVPVKDLKRLCAAEIGGALAPHEHISGDPVAQAAFDELTKRWTGITLEHYAAVANRARSTSAPGVVVCAIGQNKARAVRELVVRLRLVNRLVIDQHLAKLLAGMSGEA